MPDPRQQQDLLLAPGEFVCTLDTTKGLVNVLVGPFQSGVSGNATPIIWDAANSKFIRMPTYEDAIQRFVSVKHGEYVELTNPSKNTEQPYPRDGNSNSLPELSFGQRVVIPGPANFALWPRQSHKVIPGHRLRTNQYLVARVHNDAEAQTNRDKAVEKKAVADKSKLAKPTTPATGEAVTEIDAVAAKPEQYTTGQLIIIKGTEVSFYIPQTGIEVVPDSHGDYVRDAVTLERMEFCILREERGERRYVQGPDVVFPSPTETFVAVNGEVKFKPIMLNNISGLYIQVIADYEEGGKNYKKGQELFITGQEQAIYYPRAEHNVIAYGERQIHYAVAVPRGEGRYVLDREEGEVKLVKGPKMLLPDPRREVIVLRVLDENQVALMYPGNAKALEVNRTLKAELESSAVSVGSQRFAARALADAPDMESVQAKSAFAGESIQRGTTFRKPRTLTLDNKYEGAVCVSPYPGFAILVVNKSGERRVVEGPATILLEYDESLMPMELSTGTPKSDTRTLKTAYLQVKNNRVSDRVTVETRDLVPVDVTVAYRVNFEGDHLKWFNVDNYVRHLTEHGRSMLRGAVKRVGIEEFYRDPISIIRDALLGKAVEGGERKGLVFAENGMRVYDVDVLEVKIENTEIAGLLGNAQVEALESTLQVAAKERELATTTRVHAVERQIVEEQTKTEKAKANLQMEFVRLALTKALAEADSRAQKEAADLKALQERQGGFDAVAKAELARAKAKKDQELAAVEQELEIAIKREVQQTEDITKRASAISDKLIAALQAFGDKELMSHVAEAMAPLAIFRNSGVVEAFAGLLKGSPLEGALQLAAATTPKK